MKEIKFRYFVKFNEHMGYSDQYGCLAGFFEQYQKEIEGGNEAKLMQFTGLQDKNGRDIYEGDILEWNFWLINTEVYQTSIVEWNDKNMCFEFNDEMKPTSCEFTIIGNIYETEQKEQI